LPNEDIVPITYMGGTGGQFLCHFIVSAKRNIKDVLVNLSEYGNAHRNNLSDISSSGKFGILSSDVDKINYMLLKKPNFDAAPPYYTAAHLVNMDLVNTNFKKSIRIIYDSDDIGQLVTVFFGKCEGKRSFDKYLLKLFTSHLDQFSNKEDMPNVLFISWKELFNGNIDTLIQNISTFTNINSDNFSKESINYWRTKTQYCIDTFSV